MASAETRRQQHQHRPDPAQRRPRPVDGDPHPPVGQRKDQLVSGNDPRQIAPVDAPARQQLGKKDDIDHPTQREEKLHPCQ
jgi:hypothetical protein